VDKRRSVPCGLARPLTLVCNEGPICVVTFLGFSLGPVMVEAHVGEDHLKPRHVAG
jgi:hypothetical protein